MTQVDIQVIESKGVQTDQGANISICADRDILNNYILITPFNIGHAAKNAPPIVAVGKGYLEIMTEQGMKIRTPLYHVPNSAGTLLSPDFMCSESEGIYHTFCIKGDLSLGLGTLNFYTCDVSYDQ